MKRFLTAILALVAAAALLVLPAMAAGSSSAAISADTCVAGDQLEVTYSLAGFDSADTIGITFQVPQGLELVKAEWLLTGDVADINQANCQAVWTRETAVSLAAQTPVFKLTYRVLEPSAPTQVQISVSAIVKLGQTQLGTPSSKVTASVLLPAQGLELSKETLTLDLNGTTSAALTATVTPVGSGDKVVWSCDDSGVVKVGQDGTVTALKRGTAKVTATAGTVSKTCTVTVTCGHDLQETPAKAPTCLAGGNQQYFTCRICGCVLASDKKTETTVQAQKLERVDHTYGETWLSDDTHHWQLCTMCQEAKIGKAEHSFKWVTDKKPTEDAQGKKHEECACGAKRSLDTAIPKLDHTHADVQHHEAVAATCAQEGNVEYWTCSSDKCKDKFYGDEACTQLLETVTTAVDPENHDHSLVAKVEPTCTADGVAEHYVCQACGKYFASVNGQPGDEIAQADTLLAAAGHTYGESWSSDQAGHWHECACGHKADEAEHQGQLVGAAEATATQEGYTGDTVCGVCGYVMATGEKIPCLETQPTQPTQPTEPSDDGDEGGMQWLLVVLLLALAGVCAAIAVLLLKKKKKKA